MRFRILKDIKTGFGRGSGLLLAGLLLLAMACRDRAALVNIGAGTRYTNGTGHRQVISLPDGSKVAMNDGTTLELSAGFGKTGRDLELDGLAFFEVSGVAGTPFVVHTRNLKIEVLGTRFRVDAYRKDAGEEVDLLEGKLRVSKSYHSDSDNEPEQLEAGEMVMINRDIDLMEKEKLKPEELDKIKAQQ